MLVRDITRTARCGKVQHRKNQLRDGAGLVLWMLARHAYTSLPSRTSGAKRPYACSKDTLFVSQAVADKFLVAVPLGPSSDTLIAQRAEPSAFQFEIEMLSE